MGRDAQIIYLCVPSWDAHQEKRTNAKGEVWRPPWIKVQVDSSRDYEFSQLGLRQRGLLVEMWKLAGRLENQIPHDEKWIARAIQCKESVGTDLCALIEGGFLQVKHLDSGIVTESFGQNVPLEESREEENKSPNGDSSETHRIYNHWRERRGKAHGRYLRMSDARRDKIKTRLKEFSADELIRAIDAVALDPWEDRARHDDLTIIFRSQEQVEKFLNLLDDPALLRPEDRRRMRFEKLHEAEAQ